MTDDKSAEALASQRTNKQIVYIAAAVVAIVGAVLAHEQRLGNELAKQAVEIRESFSNAMKIHAATPHAGAAALIHHHQNNASAHPLLFKRIEDRLEKLQQGQQTVLRLLGNRRRAK